MEPGFIRALARLHYLKTATMESWQRFNEAYMPTYPEAPKRKPKWGQPGRGRMRKARLEARRLEANRQELAREVRSMLADPGTFLVPCQGGGG